MRHADDHSGLDSGTTPHDRSPAAILHLVLTGAARALVLPTLMLLVLFPAAGRLDWGRGWLLAGLFLLMLLINLPIVARRNPVLLRERFKNRTDTKPYDRVFTIGYTAGLIAFLVVGGLDGGRFGWSNLSDGWLAAGIALFFLGDLPLVLALAENPHLETSVRIQSDRGHRVVTTGPYRVVRHPMYVGLIVSFAGMPLVLGSLWSYLPMAFMTAMLVWRTAREDETLRRELEGYEAYAARTRYRLLPFVW